MAENNDQIVQNIRENGIHVIPNFLDADELAAIKEEIYAIKVTEEDWVRRKYSKDRERVWFEPFKIHELKRHNFVRNISKLFGEGKVREVSDAILGPDWYSNVVVAEERHASEEGGYGWHMDYHEPFRVCIKFFLYLGDAGVSNGALNYVPGSHKLTTSVMQWIYHGLPKRLGLMSWLQGRESAIAARMSGYERACSEAEAMIAENGRSGDNGSAEYAKDMLEMMSKHITTQTMSDDFFSYGGSAGTLLMFNDHGFHSHGPVAEGSRFILRSHHMRRFKRELWFNKHIRKIETKRAGFRRSKPSDYGRLF